MQLDNLQPCHGNTCTCIMFGSVGRLSRAKIGPTDGHTYLPLPTVSALIKLFALTLMLFLYVFLTIFKLNHKESVDDKKAC